MTDSTEQRPAPRTTPPAILVLMAGVVVVGSAWLMSLPDPAARTVLAASAPQSITPPAHANGTGQLLSALSAPMP
jgi:hypothetical protein